MTHIINLLEENRQGSKVLASVKLDSFKTDEILNRAFNKVVNDEERSFDNEEIRWQDIHECMVIGPLNDMRSVFTEISNLAEKDREQSYSEEYDKVIAQFHQLIIKCEAHPKAYIQVIEE